MNKPVASPPSVRYLAGTMTDRPSILVVEDDEDCRTVLADLLEMSGYSVISCGEAHRAVELAKEKSPALVLVDFMMPDADGLVDRFFSPAEALTYRALPEHRRPVAFFRGWTCKEAVIKAAGATTAYLAHFDVELHPDRPPRVNAVRSPHLDGAGWALTEWRAGGDIAVALAVEGAGELKVEREE